MVFVRKHGTQKILQKNITYMKKLFYSHVAVAAASMMMLASCSQDVAQPVTSGEEVNASITLQLPSAVNTRSYGDGKKALSLKYGIYELNTTTGAVTLVGGERSAEFTDLKATISVPLVTGKDYRLVFWGYDSDCTAYTVTFPANGNPTVGIDYTGIKQNDETRDAFYNYADFHVTGALNETVYLYRPFAQINFGTNDAAEDAVTTAFGDDLAKLQTKLTTQAYTSLDLVTGAATDQQEVVFDLNGLPDAAKEQFPYEPDAYRYLSMDYILVGADKSTVNCVFDVVAQGEALPLNTLTINNVPVQRNYQTNIFGQLLTTTGNFNIIIVPAFEDPDYNVPVSEPMTVLPDGNFAVSTPGHMLDLAERLAAGETFAGKTIELQGDIDMTGVKWTAPGPISEEAAGNVSHLLAGTFDGKGHTIKNLTCAATGYRSNTGLFGAVVGDIRNVTLENPSFSGSQYMGGIAAFLTSAAGTHPTVENCHIIGGTFKTDGFIGKVSGLGGIVGYSEGHTNIIDCSVDGCTLQGKDKVGGLLGKTALTYLTGCSVTNTTITSTSANKGIYYGGDNPSAAVLSGCTESGNTIN